MVGNKLILNVNYTKNSKNYFDNIDKTLSTLSLTHTLLLNLTLSLS